MSTLVEATGHTQPLSRGGYRRLVDQIREFATRSIPPGARVAVVSRGDEELLRLGGAHACHFPVDADGNYAGYHPATGADAVEHLRALRAAGTDHLMIPRTSFWWLEHYPELAAHLETEWRLLSGDHGACMIWGPPGGTVPEVGVGPVPATPVLQQQLAFLDSILPPDALLAVLGGAMAEAVAERRGGAIALAPDHLEPWPATGDRALTDAAALADYLFVPAATLAAPPRGERLIARLAGSFRLLAWREQLGVLFDLRYLEPTESS